MKTNIHILTFITFIFCASGIAASAPESDDQIKISAAVYQYEKALNENHIDGISELFTPEGTLILQGAPTVTGIEAVKEFYSSLFKALDFELKFNIEEVVEMSDEWAFVRTTTTGAVKVHSNDSVNSANGHELFILQKQTDGEWKVARYSGSSAK